MMPKYYAAPGTPFSNDDAAEIGPELAKLAKEGASSPRDIVEYARGNDTPLRRHLHMDRPIEEAAENWYRQRARLAAQSIMVVVRTNEGNRQVRAFHSVVVSRPPEENGGRPPAERRYVTINQVRDSAPLSEQVLDEALRQLEVWKDTYNTYREVFTKAEPDMENVFVAINRVTEAA